MKNIKRFNESLSDTISHYSVRIVDLYLVLYKYIKFDKGEEINDDNSPLSLSELYDIFKERYANSDDMKNVVWDGKNEFYEIDNDVYKLQSFPVNTTLSSLPKGWKLWFGRNKYPHLITPENRKSGTILNSIDERHNIIFVPVPKTDENYLKAVRVSSRRKKSRDSDIIGFMISVGHQLENDGIYIEREDYYEMKDKLVKLVTDTLNKKGYDFS